MAGRKDAYLAALPGKPQRSLLVSLADKVHNAQAIAEIAARAGRRSGPDSPVGGAERYGITVP